MALPPDVEQWLLEQQGAAGGSPATPQPVAPASDPMTEIRSAMAADKEAQGRANIQAGLMHGADVFAGLPTKGRTAPVVDDNMKAFLLAHQLQGQADEQAWRRGADERAADRFSREQALRDDLSTKRMRAEQAFRDEQAEKARQFTLDHPKSGAGKPWLRKSEPNTGKIYVEDPDTSATYWEDGSQRTPPLRQSVPGPVAAPPNAEPTGFAPPVPSPVRSPGKPRASAPSAPEAPGSIGPLESTNDKRYNKLAEDFRKDMDAAAASSRSPFGESAKVVFRGARNMAILNQKNPDGTQKQLTDPEWQEVAGGLIAMQTGGAPTQEMMHHGLPRDVSGEAASIMSWLRSKPYAPDRQEWIQRFIANIQREEETALKFQRDVQLQRAPSHSQFFSLFPNRAKVAAKGYGLDTAIIDRVRNGTYEPPGPEDETLKKPASSSGNITVMWKGKAKTIPAAKLADALAAGATEVK